MDRITHPGGASAPPKWKVIASAIVGGSCTTGHFQVLGGKSSIIDNVHGDRAFHLRSRRLDRSGSPDDPNYGLALSTRVPFIACLIAVLRIQEAGGRGTLNSVHLLYSNNSCWVKNGDRFVVTATNPDSAMEVRRSSGGAEVVLPADYVAHHVELGYATTAYRSQGRTVDTTHSMVSPTTTREVLYVAATRGTRVQHGLCRHDLRPRSRYWT